MSRPPPPVSGYSGVDIPPKATMAETQTAPPYHPPPYLDYNTRRLPQPIQLPPLAIPGQGSPRPEYQPSPPPSHAQPSYHSASNSGPPPQAPPRSQPRSYGGPAVPLDKLLSPHPYTPPRSDSAYSPSSHSPQYSSVDVKYGPSRGHERYSSDSHPRSVHHERYPSDSVVRSHQHEPQPPPYASPVEPQRPTFSSHSNHSSPATSYTSAFPQQHHTHHHSQPHAHYRSVSHPTPMLGPPSSPYAPHEPVPPPPPPPPPYPVDQHGHFRPRPYIPPAPVEPPQPSHQLPLRYELKVRQQPIAARACGFGERDRRVIDPPPIIQLTVYDAKNEIVDLDELRYSLNVVHCTLWNADGTGEEPALIQPDRRSTRRLMGQLVASPSVAKDEHDVEGCFFCFPDLSCRTHGRYRLRFVLMRLDPSNLHVGGVAPILTDVLSDVFTVYTAKDFPGMRPSSALTRALKLQGCNIQVKKGNEKAMAKKRLAQSSEEEGVEDSKKRQKLEEPTQ